MRRTWWVPWRLLLTVATLTLVGFCACEGSSSHSLQYIYTGLSEPNQGLPQFTELGYVDGQLFVQYDSNTRKTIPRVPWIKEMDKEEPQYWDWNTQRAQDAELAFRDNIHIAMQRYNHTGGLHIVQEMCGCELREDGSTGGYWQFAYDGKDFIAFDKETLTWTAADAQAQTTKRKWDARGDYNQYQKFYLEVTCIEWLKKYILYGEKSLMRKDPPEVKVTSRADQDNTETLICQADGFYPKDIDAVWTRDGEVWEQETLRGLVAPNSDGTYHTWISTKIDPKEKGRFQCLVDHCSWNKPVDFVVEEPNEKAFSLWPIVGCIALGVVLVGVVITRFWLFWKKQIDGYQAASRSDGIPSSPSHHDLEEIILEGEGGGSDGTSSSSGQESDGASISSGQGQQLDRYRAASNILLHLSGYPGPAVEQCSSGWLDVLCTLSQLGDDKLEKSSIKWTTKQKQSSIKVISGIILSEELVCLLMEEKAGRGSQSTLQIPLCFLQLYLSKIWTQSSLECRLIWCDLLSSRPRAPKILFGRNNFSAPGRGKKNFRLILN